jgi:hypothetical protein
MQHTVEIPGELAWWRGLLISLPFGVAAALLSYVLCVLIFR